MQVHKRGRTDPEDQHDEEYLQMTQLRQEAASRPKMSCYHKWQNSPTVLLMEKWPQQ